MQYAHNEPVNSVDVEIAPEKSMNLLESMEQSDRN